MNCIEFHHLLLRYLITSCSWCVCSKEFANSSGQWSKCCFFFEGRTQGTMATVIPSQRVPTKTLPFENLGLHSPNTQDKPLQNDELKNDPFLLGWFSVWCWWHSKDQKLDEKSPRDNFSTKLLRPGMLLSDVQYHVAKTGYVKTQSVSRRFSNFNMFY